MEIIKSLLAIEIQGWSPKEIGVGKIKNVKSNGKIFC